MCVELGLIKFDLCETGKPSRTLDAPSAVKARCLDRMVKWEEGGGENRCAGKPVRRSRCEPNSCAASAATRQTRLRATDGRGKRGLVGRARESTSPKKSWDVFEPEASRSTGGGVRRDAGERRKAPKSFSDHP